MHLFPLGIGAFLEPPSDLRRRVLILRGKSDLVLERIEFWKLGVRISRSGTIPEERKKVGNRFSSSFTTQTVRDEVKKYCGLEIEKARFTDRKIDEQYLSSVWRSPLVTLCMDII